MGNLFGKGSSESGPLTSKSDKKSSSVDIHESPAASLLFPMINKTDKKSNNKGISGHVSTIVYSNSCIGSDLFNDVSIRRLAQATSKTTKTHSTCTNKTRSRRTTSIWTVKAVETCVARSINPMASTPTTT